MIEKRILFLEIAFRCLPFIFVFCLDKQSKLLFIKDIITFFQFYCNNCHILNFNRIVTLIKDLTVHNL